MNQNPQNPAQEGLKLIIEYLGGIPETGSRSAFWGDISRRLAALVGKDPAWDWRYPYQVYRGQTQPSELMIRAVAALGAELDGMPAQIAGMSPITLMADPTKVKPGSLVCAESRACKNPGCRIWFIPAAWNQTTCGSPECKRVVRRLAQRARRAAKK